MNKNSWNKLPPDVQKVFEDTGGTFVGDLVDTYTEWHCKAAMDHAAKEYGVEFIELSPEELARWVAVTKPIQQEYVEQMTAKGLPGQALLDMTLKLMSQNRFTGYK
jgi:TRAP-type C4-dicarboxylate transport system substrate-binding protein